MALTIGANVHESVTKAMSLNAAGRHEATLPANVRNSAGAVRNLGSTSAIVSTVALFTHAGIPYASCWTMVWVAGKMRASPNRPSAACTKEWVTPQRKFPACNENLELSSGWQQH
eukprot:CAMPEP_0178445660 /NCGR_PEP_ID=MMETSP0689_2-20121128/40310_1 /TAXON_ID=160604 /ORGANISM="Amphidinium massartii, Strain CS-259" /LENGTH=114 /DNA_ID=CAMNT_0020070275 /DNA_START=140 /DNA_END=481 /DNA_ORIENTATION=+